MVILAWGEGNLDIILNMIQETLEVNKFATKSAPNLKSNMLRIKTLGDDQVHLKLLYIKMIYCNLIQLNVSK